MPKKGQQERTNTFGLFSDLTFISTDDKYKKAPDTLAGKYKGKQMMTANQRLQEKSFNRIFEVYFLINSRMKQQQILSEYGGDTELKKTRRF